MMRRVSIDALPFFADGGISNYVRPLVQAIIARSSGRCSVELFFRCSSRRRFRRLKALGPDLTPPPAQTRITLLPDRIISCLWNLGIPFPRPGIRDRRDIFISTTELVPRFSTARVGWIVYDLVPAQIPEFFQEPPERYLRRLKNLAAKTDFIIAISETTRKDVIELLNYPGERVLTLYPGVPPVSFLPQPPITRIEPKRPYICYLGALSRNKNVDGMLRIFADCVHNHSLDWDIVLTGKDFCGKHYWRKMTGDLRIQERVHFTGWIADEERNRLLQNAFMLWQFSWYEGFGFPVLEAAACGVPVICTNRGAVPEILENPEQEIDPTLEKESAVKIAAACGYPATLERWKKHGLKRATQFSWDKSALKLMDFTERQFS